MKRYFLSAITAAIVVSLVLVSGCTLSTANNTANQTSTPSTAESHDAFLEKFVYRLHQYTQRNYNLKAWDENWLNSTTVRLLYTVNLKFTNTVVNQNATIMHFKSTDDATAYFNSLNKTGYTLDENIYHGGIYQDVTGHAPIPYIKYVKEEKSVGRTSYQVLSEDLVMVGDGTIY